MSKILQQPVIHNVINPKTWGPSCWKFLHCICISYPLFPKEEDKEAMKAYFNSLKDVIPCYTCKEDFKIMLQDDPIDHHLNSREALCMWIHSKHNMVNMKLGAPIMSFEDSIRHWTKEVDVDTKLTEQKVNFTHTKSTGGSVIEEKCCESFVPTYKVGIVVLLFISFALIWNFYLSSFKIR